MVARRKTNVPPIEEPPEQRDFGAVAALLARIMKVEMGGGAAAGISFFLHVPPLSESVAVERGLPSTTWQYLQRVGFSRDDIAVVVGNSPKTIRRKEAQSEPLDVAEGDRTMRLLHITAEAFDAFGDSRKALAWMRHPNVALGEKTPLQMIATDAGTALVRRALGVIAYGGVA